MFSLVLMTKRVTLKDEEKTLSNRSIMSVVSTLERSQ